MSTAEQNPAAKMSDAYSKLSELEYEFDDAERELLKQQIALFKPLYEKRAAIIKDIPRFWVMVLENFGPEIDDHISPEDWALLGNHLTDVNVIRPDPEKNPRTFEIALEFCDNEWFEGTTLRKRFDYHSFRKQGFTSLTSEPLKIKWKSKEKDLTNGINDLTYKIWELKKQALELELKKPGEGKDDEEAREKMYSLEQKLEEKLKSTQSFFIFFSWMGPYFSAMQQAAKKEEDEKEEEDEDEEMDDDPPWEDIEVFPQGERTAYTFSDDLFPNAMKTFAEAVEQENVDEDLSDDDSADGSIDLESEDEGLESKNWKRKKRRGEDEEEEEDEDEEMKGSVAVKKPKRV